MTASDVIGVSTPPGVRAVFTTRRPGFSAGGFAERNLGGATDDEPDAVRANRRALCAELGLASRQVVMGTQVHGAVVRRCDRTDPDLRFTEDLTGWPEGDGLTTTAAGVALVVVVADCVPVLLWRLDGDAVGAVHAGWRGLIDGAVEAGVHALDGAVGAAVGPCAGPCCYEVDPALRERFRGRFGAETVVGSHVDLPAATRAALIAAGVSPDAISVDGSCTVCDAERFFSYRRDGARTGRQAGVIWREATI